MRDRFFVYSVGNFRDTALPLSARSADREYSDTDAGILGTQPTFVVIAPSQEQALEGARRWRKFWACEDGWEEADPVPDDLMLEERWLGHGRRAYMVLRVAA